MTSIKPFLASGVLAWVLALNLVSVGPVRAGAQEPMHHPAGATRSSGKQYEVRFLEQMIDHHLMAVEMGKECGAKATHQELKDLCQTIGSGQSAEITTMRSWLQNWYGITYAGKPMAMKGMDMSLSSMQGSVYEIGFLRGMAQHHKMAVRMGRECVTRAKHAELKTMCRTIVATQTEEIGRMQAWLCQWYQKCPPSHK